MIYPKVSVKFDRKRRLTKKGLSLNLLGIKLNQKDHCGNFLDYLSETIEKRADIEESTRKAHRKIINQLKKIGTIKKFSDLTPSCIRHYDTCLRNIYTNPETIHSYHKTLKTYINFAVRDILIDVNPYSKVKIKKRPHEPQRKYLDEEQLKCIQTLDIEDASVMRTKDIFLFQCYTGLSYSDLMLIDFTKLEKTDGRYILHRERKKTGVAFHIVLLKPAVEILEKYKFKLSIITNQKYNNALKAVTAHSGLKFNLTSHCGRHTFGTFSLNHGVKLETLIAMMGPYRM